MDIALLSGMIFLMALGGGLAAYETVAPETAPDLGAVIWQMLSG
jgi:hypothetical protein